MLQKEIVVGGEYLTRVAGDLVRVRVLAEVDRGSRAGYGSATGPKTLTRFRVQRVDTLAVLPKVRTASALHKPALDPFEALISRELKLDPAKRPELQARFLTYRFIRTINGEI